ncbi:MAG: hypothetical protein JO021_02695 [Alphaproteobacteria bacterium]|nr:hypothetical protein [Alphaproteobacteria bacterium]
MVKPVSPYLQRPLRTLEEALRELGQDAPGDAGRTAPDAAPPPAPVPAKAGTPKDQVTIAGVDVPIEPAAPETPTTGSQLDVKA